MEHPLIPNIKKIAVLRAINLGDFIIALPALAALRHAYPHARIDLLTRPWTQELVHNRPLPFDSLVPVPMSRGVYDGPGLQEDPTELNRFFTERQQEQYDLAIQLHGGGQNSNAFIKRLNARHTAGTRTPNAPMLDRWIPYELYHHEVHRWLEVVALVGAKPVTITPALPVIQKDRDDAKKVMHQLNKYLVIHPGASDPRRRWPAEKYARIGDIFAEKGYRIILTGTEEEQTLVDHVQQHMNQHAYNLAGKLSLNGLIGVLSYAKVLVANDTGPMHLARAIGTPTVGIYWFPNMIHWSPVTREHNQTAISWIQQCPQCGQYLFDETSHIPLNELKGCGHISSFVEPVSVDEVYEKTITLLDHSY